MSPNAWVYAGIGSRATPVAVLRRMRVLATDMAPTWLVRSGGARGADLAFEHGARDGAGRHEIYRPYGTIPELAFQIAAAHHPCWSACGPHARRLLARNAQVILGRDLDAPADLVLYWHPPGLMRGGTYHALSIARASGVHVQDVTTVPEDWDYQLASLLAAKPAS